MWPDLKEELRVVSKTLGYLAVLFSAAGSVAKIIYLRYNVKPTLFSLF